jgi:phage baseplate assembly protein W
VTFIAAMLVDNGTNMAAMSLYYVLTAVNDWKPRIAVTTSPVTVTISTCEISLFL